MNSKVKTFAVLLASILVSCCGKSPTMSNGTSECHIRVMYGPGIDDAAKMAHREAMDHVTMASEGLITFTTSRVGGNIFAYGTPVEQGEGVAGARGDLTHGELIYTTTYWAGRRPIVEHEILHLVGLPDNTHEGSLMCNGCLSNKDPNRGMNAEDMRQVRDIALRQCGG